MTMSESGRPAARPDFGTDHEGSGISLVPDCAVKRVVSGAYPIP